MRATLLILTLLIGWSVYPIVSWWGTVRAQDNPYQVEITGGMRKAMLRMGPLKTYKISPEQKIYVAVGGKWQRLYWRGR